MSDEPTDAARQAYQRDQAEGERDDDVETRVTRGSHGADQSTRQQSAAERDPAEGSDEEAEQ
ncbi:MAG: hypothetical protein M3380_03175 [Chloroflexota bacterium]|nr:hypothetical protein [Chloroflexota bacterium]